MRKLQFLFLTTILSMPILAFGKSGIMMSGLSPISNSDLIEYQAGNTFLPESDSSDSLIQGIIETLARIGKNSGIDPLSIDYSNQWISFNEAENRISIYNYGNKDMSIFIVSLQGTLLLNHNLNSKKEEIDLTNLPKGIHIIGCVYDNKIVRSQKIVIK